MKFMLLFLIRLYQLCIRPFIGDVCRFTPTCSCYATEALQKHGIWRGLWLSCKRICRCGPWSAGGLDDVP